MENEKDSQSSIKKAKFFVPTSFDENKEYNPLFDVNNTIEPSRIVHEDETPKETSTKEEIGGVSFSVPEEQEQVEPVPDQDIQPETSIDMNVFEHAQDPALVDVLRAGDSVAVDRPEFVDALHAEKVSFEDYEQEREKDPLRDPTLMPKKDSAMRTYFSDVQHVTTTSDPKTISTVFDTVRKEEIQKKQDSSWTKKNILYGILSFLVLGASVFVLVIFVLPQFMQMTTVGIVNQNRIHTLLPADMHATVTITTESLLSDMGKEIQNVLQDGYTFGSLVALHPVIKQGLSNQSLNSKQFLDILGISAPLGFLGTLEENPFMFGVFSGASNYPFLVLRVSAYDNAFSGMRNWEDTLVSDMKHVFALPVDALRMTYEKAPFENTLWKNRTIRRVRFNTALVSQDRESIPRTFQNVRLESESIGDLILWYPETMVFQGNYVPVVETEEIINEESEEQILVIEESDTQDGGIEIQDDGVIMGTVFEEVIPMEITFPILFTTFSGEEIIIDRDTRCPLLPDSVVDASLSGGGAQSAYRVNACARIGEEDVLIAKTNTTDGLVVSFLASLDQYVEKIILDTTSRFVPSYDEGETVLLYTFLNENTLLITTHESVLEEAIRRMARSTLLQIR
jgi:hypothetical protein